MKTQPEWLREFADAMEADPSRWWRQYEYETGLGVRGGFVDGLHALGVLMGGAVIHRRPRTVTRFDRNGEPVELPELAESGTRYWPDLSFRAHKPSDADKWAEYLRSLLENRDD